MKLSATQERAVASLVHRGELRAEQGVSLDTLHLLERAGFAQVEVKIEYESYFDRTRRHYRTRRYVYWRAFPTAKARKLLASDPKPAEITRIDELTREVTFQRRSECRREAWLERERRYGLGRGRAQLSLDPRSSDCRASPTRKGWMSNKAQALFFLETEQRPSNPYHGYSDALARAEEHLHEAEQNMARYEARRRAKRAQTRRRA